MLYRVTLEAPWFRENRGGFAFPPIVTTDSRMLGPFIHMSPLMRCGECLLCGACQPYFGGSNVYRTLYGQSSFFSVSKEMVLI